MRLIYILSILFALPCSGEDTHKSEIEMQAERIGINIETLTKAVERGVPGALDVYISLVIDGGGGEIFQEHDRPRILRSQPDDRLAETLAEFSPAKIARIEREFTFDLTTVELEDLHKRFPLTFALIDKQKKPNKAEMATPRKPSD